MTTIKFSEPKAIQPGEHYAGVVVNESGQVTHHLVLMAQRPDGKLQWQAAVDWATSVGGALPTLQEQALLYTNCNPHIKPEWHWSGDTRTDNVYLAWCCSFSGGYRGIIRKSSESFAVAVRRIPVNAPAAPVTAPSWHDAPTSPGVWLSDRGYENPYRWGIYNVVDPDHEKGMTLEDERWFGPISPDTGNKP